MILNAAAARRHAPPWKAAGTLDNALVDAVYFMVVDAVDFMFVRVALAKAYISTVREHGNSFGEVRTSLEQLKSA